MTLAKPRPTPTLPLEPTQIKRWSVDEYHHMSDLGLLDSNERTELIAGHLTLKASKSPSHVVSLHLLQRIFEPFLVSQNAFVSTQDPIHLDDFSEPEPDLAIVQGNILDYAEQHPRPDQVYLVVEVADSTLEHDYEVKDKLYAQAGITEYWVLDLPNRQLHVFRDPTLDGYIHHLILRESDQVSPLAFLGVAIGLFSILPPIP